MDQLPYLVAGSVDREDDSFLARAFPTSAQKVRSPFAIWQQNQTFRSHALGNFGSLAKAVSRDPAMLIWLDLFRSRKESPNENFARELLELFMLGEGHYRESDIKAAARAFTGYRINPLNGSFRFTPAAFDNDEKCSSAPADPGTATTSSTSH